MIQIYNKCKLKTLIIEKIHFKWGVTKYILLFWIFWGYVNLKNNNNEPDQELNILVCSG